MQTTKPRSPEETQLTSRLAAASSKRRDLLRYIDKLEELVGVLWAHSQKYGKAKVVMADMERTLQAQNNRIEELIVEQVATERKLLAAQHRISSLESQRAYLTGRVI